MVLENNYFASQELHAVFNKRGKEMFVADVLPRACSKYSEPVMQPQLEFWHQMELTEHFPTPNEQLKRLQKEPTNGPSKQYSQGGPITNV